MALAHTDPRLWYERSGSGPPLLCITGFAISSAVFEPVLDLYAERFDCITYDHRGSGRSATPLKPTSIPELAGDAAQLLDHLGVASAHVYGISMGGMVALELALRFPDRVRGLVLGGTTAGGPLAARPSLKHVRASAEPSAEELLNPANGWLAALLFSPEFRHDEPDRARWLLEHFTRHRPHVRGATAQWWATVVHDTVSRLCEIASPTLVMHGERDAMSPLANSELLAARIPDAELAIVRGAGHAYPLERPRESFELFRRWIDAREPIAPGPTRAGALAAAEPFTRPLGLPIGLARTAASAALLARGWLPRRTR